MKSVLCHPAVPETKLIVQILCTIFQSILYSEDDDNGSFIGTLQVPIIENTIFGTLSLMFDGMKLLGVLGERSVLCSVTRKAGYDRWNRWPEAPAPAVVTHPHPRQH